MKFERRSLFAVDRPSLLAGVRIATSALVPLIVGQLLGQSPLALLVAMGGLNVAASDTGGFFRLQILSLLATTVGITVAAFLGTLAGNTPWGAMLVTLAATLVVGLAGAFGKTVSRASFPALMALLIMLGRPGHGSAALAHGEALLLGAGWAMALSLLLTLVHRRQPGKNAVVAYYRSIQTFLDKAGEVALSWQDESAPWEKATQNEHTAVLQAHRTASTTLNTGLPLLFHLSAQDRRLFSLLLAADRLFAAVVDLLEALEKAGHFTHAEHIQTSLGAALHSLLLSVERCILSIENGEASSQQDLRQLGQAIGVLKQQVHPADPFQLRPVIQDFEQLQEILQEVINIERLPTVRLEDERSGELLHHFSRLSMGEIRQRMRGALDPRAQTFRHMVRLSFTGTLAVTLYELFHIPYGYWITLVAVAVLQPQLSVTRQRAIKGIAATVVGGIIAALLMVSVHTMLLLDLLLLVAGVMAFSSSPQYFGRFYLFLTLFLLLLFDLVDPGSWQIAFIRMLNTLIGGVLGYLASALLWPQGTRVSVADQLADLILANRDYLHGAVTAALEHHADAKALYQAASRVKITSTACVDAYQQLQEEQERPRGNLAHLGKLMSCNLYFAESVSALASELSHLSDRSCLTTFRPLTQEGEHLLTNVAEAVRCEQRLPHSVQQGERIQRLQAALARLQPGRAAGGAKKQHETRLLECQAALYTYLKPLTDTIIGMYAEQVGL